MLLCQRQYTVSSSKRCSVHTVQTPEGTPAKVAKRDFLRATLLYCIGLMTSLYDLCTPVDSCGLDYP